MREMQHLTGTELQVAVLVPERHCSRSVRAFLKKPAKSLNRPTQPLAYVSQNFARSLMQYQTTIHGEGADIWTRGGTVEAVTLRSATQVWTQGGGGYVGPHGGYVSAPQVRSAPVIAYARRVRKLVYAAA